MNGAVSIWDTQKLCDMCQPSPDEQIATLSFSGKTSSLYAIGEPASGGLQLFDQVLTLSTPVYLPAGTYALGLQNGLLLIGQAPVLFGGFPAGGPGAAMQIRGATPVPEPNSVALLGMAIVAASTSRRWRSRSMSE